jgi:hypothetical protein
LLFNNIVSMFVYVYSNQLLIHSILKNISLRVFTIFYSCLCLSSTLIQQSKYKFFTLFDVDTFLKFWSTIIIYMCSHLSHMTVINEIEHAVRRKKNIILFKNNSSEVIHLIIIWVLSYTLISRPGFMINCYRTL